MQKTINYAIKSTSNFAMNSSSRKYTIWILEINIPWKSTMVSTVKTYYENTMNSTMK